MGDGLEVLGPRRRAGGAQSLVSMGPGPLQKAESEELEVQKPQVKLRRAVSEVARPSSTPPIMASAVKDEDDEDRIIAELEVGQGCTWPPESSARPPPFACQADPRVRCRTRTGDCILGSPLRLLQEPLLLASVSSPL